MHHSAVQSLSRDSHLTRRDALVGHEIELLNGCKYTLDQIAQSHPEWFADFEDRMPDFAPRSQVLDLLERAPTEFARGLMYGKLLARVEIAQVSGVPFE